MTRHWLYVIANSGDVWFLDAPLIVRYPEGDVDVVNKNMKNFRENLHRALYDLYQCTDRLKDGDDIMLFGRPQFGCRCVHVVDLEQGE